MRRDHSFEGEEEPPGSLQLLPTTAMGSGMAFVPAMVTVMTGEMGINQEKGMMP